MFRCGVNQCGYTVINAAKKSHALHGMEQYSLYCTTFLVAVLVAISHGSACVRGCWFWLSLPSLGRAVVSLARQNLSPFIDRFEFGALLLWLVPSSVLLGRSIVRGIRLLVSFCPSEQEGPVCAQSRYVACIWSTHHALLHTDIRALNLSVCRESDSNAHGLLRPGDFKSPMSTIPSSRRATNLSALCVTVHGNRPHGEVAKRRGGLLKSFLGAMGRSYRYWPHGEVATRRSAKPLLGGCNSHCGLNQERVKSSMRWRFFSPRSISKST